ncbi:Uncharacterized protein DAT39_016107 [Clarias magur]|uniref:Uncharacterized protein n=1 Tax=Clarias magur TaxID=1594786 RepID=A0A8J4UAK4_CLAMG|nr:Uncharacterized protein DAT39_016107 [Clarias magur]
MEEVRPVWRRCGLYGGGAACMEEVRPVWKRCGLYGGGAACMEEIAAGNVFQLCRYVLIKFASRKTCAGETDIHAFCADRQVDENSPAKRQSSNAHNCLLSTAGSSHYGGLGVWKKHPHALRSSPRDRTSHMEPLTLTTTHLSGFLHIYTDEETEAVQVAMASEQSVYKYGPKITPVVRSWLETRTS